MGRSTIENCPPWAGEERFAPKTPGACLRSAMNAATARYARACKMSNRAVGAVAIELWHRSPARQVLALGNMSVSNPLGALPQTTDPAANVEAVRTSGGPPTHVQHDAVSHDQVAPDPKFEVDQQHLDRRSLIADAIQAHPGAAPDEIVRLLAEKQIEVSATLVLAELARRSSYGTA